MPDADDQPRPRSAWRWIRRAVAVIALLVAAGLGVVAYVIAGVGDVPDYYAAPRLSGEDRLEAIASVERQFVNFQGQLSDAVATEATAPEAEPEPATMRFGAAEVDAWFAKWLDDHGYREAFTRHLAEPRLLIVDGRLVLAGRAELDWLGDVVISLRFVPEVGEGDRVRLRFEGVSAGHRELPDAAVSAMRERSLAALGEATAAERKAVALADDGTANVAAVRVAIDRQARQLLSGGAVDPLVLFPPVVGRGPVAAEVVELAIEGDQLRLGVLPLTPDERAELVEKLRRPADAASPEPVAAGPE